MATLIKREGDLPRRTLWQRIRDVALTDVGAIARTGSIAGSIESIEQLLLEADFGVSATLQLVDDLSAQARRGVIKTQDDFHSAMRNAVEQALRHGNSLPALQMSQSAPTVILVLGVNGAGKTTFIGKLAAHFRSLGKSVLVGAADTFRAGAINQLRAWAERSGAEFVGAKPGADPASVAFDAIDAAVVRKLDVAIIDTAGRLHTSDSLMEELRKINRVIGKRLPGAPHESLLVLDGTVGQNAIAQAKTFAEAVPISGVVITKLDGTASGGIVVAVHQALDVPIKFIGTGEQLGDLEIFDAHIFAESLLGD